MSKRRKDEIKNKKRNKSLIIFLAILFIVIFGLGVFWSMRQRNIAKNSIESFIPNDLISLAIMDINTDSKQNVKLSQLAQRIGDDKVFTNYLQSLILLGISPSDLKVDETTFMGWLGNQIAVGNIRVTNDHSSNVFILSVKNKDLLNNFLGTFTDDLSQKGYVIQKDDFRQNQITTIKKQSSISYALYGNYLLVSQYADGLKKMIDTKLGRDKSIAFDGNYKKARNKLNNQDGVVFVYGDIPQLVRVFLKSNLKLDQNILGELTDLTGKYYGAAKLSALDDRIQAKIYLPDFYKISGNKKIKPKLADLVSSDTAMYLEGASLKPLLESLIVGNASDPQSQLALLSRGAQLQYGIDILDLLNTLDGQFGVYLAPDFSNSKLSLALIIDTKGKKDVKAKIDSFDKNLEGLVSKYLANDEPVHFINREHKGINYKIIPLPKKTFDLGYFVDNDKLVIFTNESVLNSFSPKNKLSDDPSFKELGKSSSEQIVFSNIGSLLKLSDSFNSESNSSSSGNLLKSLSSLRITKDRSWSGNFINAELLVK